MASSRLSAQDEKFYASVGRHRRRRPNRRAVQVPVAVRRYSREDEMTEPANARALRPYVYGQEPLL